MDDLELTLAKMAQQLNQHALPWMVIGGAAMVLYGLEKGPVNDIDIVLPSHAAAFLSKKYAWPNYADETSLRFRSDFLLRPETGPVPVELLGGFHILTEQGWTALSVGETVTVSIRSQQVCLPVKAQLAAILRLCGREKDLKRMMRLSGTYVS